MADLDVPIRKIIRKNPNMLVPHYLMHSYLYYVLDTAVISDTYYETICKDLLNKWDLIEHRHKSIIDKQSLKAGTGYYLKEGDYPGLVVGAALYLVDRFHAIRKGTN